MTNQPEKQLTEKQMHAIRLLAEKEVAKHRKDKERLTNEEIAKQVGVNPATIYEWKKDRQFKRALVIESRETMEDALFSTYAKIAAAVDDKTMSEKNRLEYIRLQLKTLGQDKAQERIIIEHQGLDDLARMNADVIARAKARRERE